MAKAAAAVAKPAKTGGGAPRPPRAAKIAGGKRKLILLAAPAAAGGIGAGLWFSGILPPCSACSKPRHAAEAAKPRSRRSMSTCRR